MAEPLANYRGQGYVRGEGCLLPAHYPELQALCDALGYAAQQEMAEAVECGDEVGRERAYGKWLGLRGILRAIEGRIDEWTPGERTMLGLIDWSKPQFRFPGIEAFDGADSQPSNDGSS
jgi:hypothetical protein